MWQTKRSELISIQDFRGANLTINACVSELGTIGNIDDAITYAIEKIQTFEHHLEYNVVGGLVAVANATSEAPFMKSNILLEIFRLGIISDFNCLVTGKFNKGNNYARNILDCNWFLEDVLYIESAKQKSPIYFETQPAEKLKKFRTSYLCGSIKLTEYKEVVFRLPIQSISIISY